MRAAVRPSLRSDPNPDSTMRGHGSRYALFALALLLGVAGVTSSGVAAGPTLGAVAEAPDGAFGAPRENALLAAGLLFSDGFQASEYGGSGSGTGGDAVVGGRQRARSRVLDVHRRPFGPARAVRTVRRTSGLLGMEASPANAPPRS